MLDAIADYLKDQFAAKHYADLVAGLVRARSYKREGTELFLPFALAPFGAKCGPAEEVPIVPDDGRRSIIFFDDVLGVTPLTMEGGFIRFRASLRLNVWLNLARLGLSPDPSNSWAFRVVMDLVRGLPTGFVNIPAANVNKLDLSVGTVYPRRELWARFTLDPTVRDFYDPARFDMCTVDIDCEWRVSLKCIMDIPENPGTVC